MRYRWLILAIGLLFTFTFFYPVVFNDDSRPTEKGETLSPWETKHSADYRAILLQQFQINQMTNEKLKKILKTEALSLLTCHFDQRYLSGNYFETRTLADKHNGSCTPAHTWFNERNSTIRMKCHNSTHIPFIYIPEQLLNTKYVLISQNVERWFPFPKEYYDTGREYEVDPRMDVIHTACVDLRNASSYHSFFVRSIRNETLVQSKKKQMGQYLNGRKDASAHQQLFKKLKDMKKRPLNRPLDIHVILLDSVGRDFFGRQFVHSKQALEQLKRRNDDIDVLEFSQYQIVGQNTAMNMYQFSSGLPIMPRESYSTATRRRLEGHPMTVPFFWDHLKEMGYVTSIGGDMGERAYSVGSFYGYKNQVLTYDLYPSFHKVAHYVEDVLKNCYVYKIERCPCVGSRFMSDVTFEFARSMFREYHDIPKFLMTIHNDAHNPVGTQSMMLDRDLSEYLTYLGESGSLSHTAVLILADHGIHYGDHYKTHRKQALLEHGRPFATLILPKYVTSDELRSNANRTVNIRDFHMTLRDIGSFPERSSPKGVQIAQSLLHDLIAQNRTCEQMMVHKGNLDACPIVK